MLCYNPIGKLLSRVRRDPDFYSAKNRDEPLVCLAFKSGLARYHPHLLCPFARIIFHCSPQNSSPDWSVSSPDTSYRERRSFPPAKKSSVHSSRLYWPVCCSPGMAAYSRLWPDWHDVYSPANLHFIDTVSINRQYFCLSEMISFNEKHQQYDR